LVCEVNERLFRLLLKTLNYILQEDINSGLLIYGVVFIFLLFADAMAILAKSSAELLNHFFSVRLLSVLRGHLFFSSPPQRPMTSDFERFSIQDVIHYIYFPIFILEKAPEFPLLMFSAK